MKRLTSDIISAIAKDFGESFYILDSDVFCENYERLIGAFKHVYQKTNIAYSYKTNYTPKLAKIVNGFGGFAEIVSAMELEIAYRSGVDSDRIIWNGPVKRREDAEPFLLDGGIVNVDSLLETYLICRIAKDNPDRIINIGIRCNYDIGDDVVSRFGIDVLGDDFDKAIELLLSVQNIKIESLQAHFAKRNCKYWEAKAEGMIKVYESIHSKYGVNPSILDLGGGMSGEIPESLRVQLGLDACTFDDYAIKAATVFNSYFSNDENAPWLFIEPGTALVADSMRYVCRVETVKNIRGKDIITTNGSQKNINMLGLNPPLEVIHVNDGQNDYANADIAGYTCIETDYLYKDFNGKLAVGDYFVFKSCGSYSIVMKPPFIFPNVPIIDISKDEIEIIKRRETFDDLFQSYNF